MACRDGDCDRCKLVCADLHIEELEAEVSELKEAKEREFRISTRLNEHWKRALNEVERLKQQVNVLQSTVERQKLDNKKLHGTIETYRRVYKRLIQQIKELKA